MSATPDTVVVDVGHVLVGVDARALLALLEEHGARFESLDALCSAVDLDAHEAGAVDGGAFLARLASRLGRPMDPRVLLREWNAIYFAHAPMLELARRLRGAYRLFLLSNMGELHWTHLEAAFGIRSLAHDALASWEARTLKPDPAIYALAERRFGLEPARTVFVDDRPDNCGAARARGWHAVRHRTAADTAAALAALGLAVAG
jgi:2-haloacid dehalogenase